jgi:hypothetical protein
MVNYQNGKIYKIVDNTNGNVYIGSTCKILYERIAGHKYDYKKYLKGYYHFVTSFKILENKDYKIELIELYPCNSKIELHKRERYYIENNECVNKVIPSRTPKESQKEYYKNNKNDIKESQKEYYKNNKNEINKKHNCNCGGKYTLSHKGQHFKSKKHQQYCQLITLS